MIQIDATQAPLLAPIQEWWRAQHQHPEYQEPAATLGEVTRFGGPMPACTFDYGCDWRQGRSDDALIESLKPYLTAKTVQAAQALQQPPAQVGLALASALLPKPYGTELNVVADLIEAAGAQTLQDRDRAINRTFAAVGGSIVLGLVLAVINTTPEQRKAWW